MRRALRILVSAALVAVPALLPCPAVASDHADPVVLVDPESNLTDLFFFPRGDQYVLIFDVRRALTDPPPYGLSEDTFRVNIDLHSRIDYDDAADRARYGGTIVTPGGIAPDATIEIHLDDDASLKRSVITGLTGQDGIRVWSGVRDDPFIFPPFFKKNSIATVMTIPRTSFPPGRQDFLLWATTWRDGEQIDHVGRSIRTQLPRYASLPGEPIVNLLPPKEQVPAMAEVNRGREKITDFINRYSQTAPLLPVWQTTVEMRSYDLPTPDVMVFTTRFPPGYPNGRRLEDDVVALACRAGDCLLQELALRTGLWPQPTTNDKPFRADFPFLADPWPSAPEPPPTAKSIVPRSVVLVLLLLFVLSVVPFWIGYKWGWRRCRRAAA